MWNKDEIKLFSSMNIASVQRFLDDIAYDARIGTSSPRYVIKERSANCFEGALFGAAALEFLGYKPLILDMLAHNDDDHVIAVYNEEGHWGSIAKSNCTTLRGREPVYRNLRELVMSYFDLYFNVLGDKTLRSYSKPVNLNKYSDWRTTADNLDYIGDDLNKLKHYPLLTDTMEKNLVRAHPLVLEATLLGSVEDGLYKVK